MKSSNPIERLITSPLCAAVICPVGGFAIWFFSAQQPPATQMSKPVEQHITVQRRIADVPPASVASQSEVNVRADETRNSSSSTATRIAGHRSQGIAPSARTRDGDASAAVDHGDGNRSIGQRDAERATVQRDISVAESKPVDAPAVKLAGTETPKPAEPSPTANAKKSMSSSPESVLENRGLQRAGKFYVVATEKEIGAGFGRIIPIYNVMETVLIQFQAILDAEATWQFWDNERIVAQTYLRDLALQLSNTPNNAVNRLAIQQLRNEQQGTQLYLSNVLGSLEVARKNLVPPARKQAVWNDFLTRRIDFLESSKQLRPVVDKAVKEYAALEQDPAVKDAVQTIAQARKFPDFARPVQRLDDRDQ